MDLSTRNGKIGAAVVALLVVGLIYILWVKSVPPEPVIPAGQSLSNPTGSRDESPRRKRE